MNIGIIGAGYIGNKRAEIIMAENKDKILAIFDVDRKRSEFLAEKVCASAVKNYQEILNDKMIESVIVAAINSASAKLSKEAILKGKNVFCEKPLGINYQEAKQVFDLAKKKKVVLKVGFNHRFHPAIKMAYDLTQKGAIGKMLYIRAVYGHGGRQNYDLEWRMKKELSGGGELIDQGIHLIDLTRWFLGEFKEAFAFCQNLFWKKSRLEDNAFCVLKTKDKKIAFFQASITQWKNKFLFEMFGEKGYIIIDGLGRSYGKEKLIFGQREKLGEKPKEEIFEFDEDISWKEEWKEFVSAIKEKREPIGNGRDGMMANKIIEALYKSSKLKRIVKI